MNINIGRIAFYLRARNKYKIHSPLLFSFTNKVIEDRDIYYADLDLKRLHEFILANFPDRKKNLLSLIFYSTLFRIGKWFQPQQIYIRGDQDGDLSAIALNYGARNACISIQLNSFEMEEWIRKHFKLFNIPDPPVHFLKAEDDFKCPSEQKALYLMDASLMESIEFKNYHDVFAKSSVRTCVILTHLSKSNSIRKSWMALTKSTEKGIFYIDLYDIGVIIYTGNEQESVYQAIVSYRKKWFQVY